MNIDLPWIQLLNIGYQLYILLMIFIYTLTTTRMLYTLTTRRWSHGTNTGWILIKYNLESSKKRSITCYIFPLGINLFLSAKLSCPQLNHLFQKLFTIHHLLFFLFFFYTQLTPSYLFCLWMTCKQ